jgi:hypothetical protein
MLLRQPLQLGGCYWLANVLLSQASVFAAVHLYNEHAVMEEGVEKISPRFLWRGAGALAVLWVATFGYFVLRIAVPKYWHTLWSTTTGRQVVHGYFLEGESDAIRFEVFRRNKLLWEREIGEEVKAWTMENWGKWVTEKPVWFTDKVIATVPDAYIPPAFLGSLGPRRERRGSAAGSVRESFRE